VEQRLFALQDETKAAQDKGKAVQKETSRLWGVFRSTKAKVANVAFQQKQEQVSRRTDRVNIGWLCLPFNLGFS
jgi:hypothetical protein